MNPFDFINALNEGKTLVNRFDRTVIKQIDDRLHIRTAIMVLEDRPKIDVWAISGHDCAQLFYKDKPIISIRTTSFEVMEE